MMEDLFGKGSPLAYGIGKSLEGIIPTDNEMPESVQGRVDDIVDKALDILEKSISKNEHIHEVNTIVHALLAIRGIYK